MTSDIETYIQALAGRFHEQGLSFSIHHKVVFADNQIAFPGQAFTDVAKAAMSARYWTGKGADTYLAMGGERDTEKSDKPRPFPKAIRKRYNVGACSALYLDIDVKPDGYTTQQEALSAVKDFLLATNIPIPTFIVSSGTGGVHIYWVPDDLFLPVEFEVMASSLVNLAHSHGLKFDPNCTNDICRLLRPPETWNFKVTPALPVKLLYSGSNVPLALLRERLKVNNVIPLRPGTDDNDDLLIKQKQYPLADIDVVSNECPFLHNTLMAGGTEQPEPIWKLAISLATYCKDGRDVAHRLSNKHVAYSQEETDLKFDQAEMDRRNNPRLGPPHCAVFQRAGVSECGTCRHLQLNTTPINVLNFSVASKTIYSHRPDSDLPKEYRRDQSATVWADVSDKSGGTGGPMQVFPFPLIFNSAFIESDDREYSFVFSTLEGNGHTKQIKIPMSAASNRDALAMALARNGVPLTVTEQTRKFFVAFQTLLRSNDETLMSINPLGWYTGPDGITGFSYNGKCYFPAGKTLNTQKLDRLFADSYCVSGEEKYWRELSGLLIDEDRQDVNTIIACGFAAPLISLTGHAGIAVGAWSSKSGLSKSTALAIMQAIWGSTSRMQGLDDTANQAVDTMATLKSMPVGWDEVKGNVQAEKMANIIFGLSRGREKGRLNRNAEQLRQREFETLLVWTSNNPLADTIARATRGTIAGYYRILEFCMDETFTTKLDVGHITNLNAMLKRNHGHIGQLYAEFLGANHLKVKDWVNKMRDKIDAELRTTQSERFWSSAAACIIVGARLANGLKFANFNLVGLEKFLYERILEFRDTAKHTNSGDLSNLDNVELMLGEFLHAMAQNTIKTDTAIVGTGRPIKGSVKVLNDNLGFTRTGVHVQIAKDTLLLRVADPAIGEWAHKMGMAKSAVTGAFKKHLGAVQKRGRIGSGTDYVSPPLFIWEVDLSKTTIGTEMEF